MLLAPSTLYLLGPPQSLSASLTLQIFDETGRPKPVGNSRITQSSGACNLSQTVYVSGLMFIWLYIHSWDATGVDIV